MTDPHLLDNLKLRCALETLDYAHAAMRNTLAQGMLEPDQHLSALSVYMATVTYAGGLADRLRTQGALMQSSDLALRQPPATMQQALQAFQEEMVPYAEQYTTALAAGAANPPRPPLETPQWEAGPDLWADRVPPCRAVIPSPQR